MESISAVSGILTIVGSYQTFLKRARNSLSYPKDATLELEIYGEILSDQQLCTTKRHSAKQCSDLHAAMHSTHRSCGKNLPWEKSGVLRAALRNHEALESSLKGLKNRIMLLRNIVMDSITHTLLREQREARGEASIDGGARFNIALGDGDLSDEELAKITQSISSGLGLIDQRTINGGVIMNLALPRRRSASETEARDRDIDQFRQEFHAVQARSAANPFTRAVHIVPKDHARLHEVVMAKFDTQSTPNWINTEIIERLDMMEETAPYDGPDYHSATGEPLIALGIISLQWYDLDIAKSRYTFFIVTTKDAPFDLIIGWQLLKEEGIAVFPEPVLAIREIKLTPEQTLEMQAAVLARDDRDTSLAAIRRAQEADKHDRKRRLRAEAASRAPSVVSSRMTSRVASLVPTRRPSLSSLSPVGSTSSTAGPVLASVDAPQNNSALDGNATPGSSRPSNVEQQPTQQQED